MLPKDKRSREKSARPRYVPDPDSGTQLVSSASFTFVAEAPDDVGRADQLPNE